MLNYRVGLTMGTTVIIPRRNTNSKRQTVCQSEVTIEVIEGPGEVLEARIETHHVSSAICVLARWYI